MVPDGGTPSQRFRRRPRDDDPVYWLLLYDVVDDYLDLRTPFRSDHLARATAAAERGDLRLAGACGDPPDGAVLVFTGADSSVAEAFARDDPYVKEGVVTSWRVVPWNVVAGVDAVLE